MPTRRNIVEVKAEHFGRDKVFRLRRYTRSTAAGYAVKLTVWHVVNDAITKIVDGAACTAVFSSPDTFVTYTPTAPSPFDTPGDYLGEFNFTRAAPAYDEDVKTLAWRVIPSSRASAP